MGHLLGIGERDFVHKVPTPETVRVASFIAPPHGWGRRWWSGMEGRVHLTFEALDRGGANLKLLAILHIPHDALRPQVRPQLEAIPRPLQDLLRYPSCRG